MSSGDIKINFPALASAASELTSQANSIEGLLGEERGVLDSLDGAWTGSAKEAWHANQQRWQTKADELNLILDQLAKALTDVAADFESQEKRSAEQWGG